LKLSGECRDMSDVHRLSFLGWQTPLRKKTVIGGVACIFTLASNMLDNTAT